jgi:hypothetical protein
VSELTGRVVTGNRVLVRFHEIRARIRREQHLGRVVREHDATIEKQRIGVDELIGGDAGWCALHEVTDRQDPYFCDRDVKLGGGGAMVREEREQGRTHPFRRGFRIPLAQIDVGRAHVGAVIELRRREGPGLETCDELTISFGCGVTHDSGR